MRETAPLYHDCRTTTHSAGPPPRAHAVVARGRYRPGRHGPMTSRQRRDGAVPDGGAVADRDDPLALDGHRIVPAAKREGSVRRWRCLDCDAEATDAESYLDLECRDGPSRS